MKRVPRRANRGWGQFARDSKIRASVVRAYAVTDNAPNRYAPLLVLLHWAGSDYYHRKTIIDRYSQLSNRSHRTKLMASGHDEPAVSPKGNVHSTSYTKFQTEMDKIGERFTPLNPKDGYLYEQLRKKDDDLIILNEAGMEFIRGGIIATVAAWEGFVLDLFKEAFEILVKVGSGQPASIEKLKGIWPGCDAAIENGKKGKQPVAVPYDDLTRHSKKVLEHCSFQPIFIGRPLKTNLKEEFMHIDRKFVELFQADRTSLSQLVIQVGTFNYSMPYTGNWKDPRVILHERDTSNPNYEYALKALNNISRLYYGLRCILGHSHYQKTLEGSLRDFPKSEDTFHLPTACKRKEEIAKYYTRLYCWIEEHNREVWVNYQTLLIIKRF